MITVTIKITDPELLEVYKDMHPDIIAEDFYRCVDGVQVDVSVEKELLEGEKNGNS